jgi:hypothetical protein
MSMTQDQYNAAVADGRFGDLLKEAFYRDANGNIHLRTALAADATISGSAARGLQPDADTRVVSAMRRA